MSNGVWSKVGNIMGPAGPPGTGFGGLVIGEIPAGAVDGVNKTFATSIGYQPTTLAVYFNGLRQLRGSANDYVELTATSFTFLVPPIVGDLLEVDYITSTGTAFVVGEIPTGTVDGVNTSYHSANSFEAGTLEVHLNGMRLRSNDYSETGASTFVLNVAPKSGDLLLIDYVKL